MSIAEGKFIIKNSLSIILFFVLLSSCQRGFSPEQEIAPAEAVDASFIDLDQKLLDFQALIPSSVHDPADFKVVGAKQIGLDNRNFAPGVLEQWCIAIDYVRHNVQEDMTFNSTAIYLAGRFEDGWVARRTEYRSEGIFDAYSSQKHWDYICSR